MGRYEIVKAAYGYTDADFGPNQVYLTPRAAETAMAAGIAAIRPLKPEVGLIKTFVNSQMTNPAYRFPENTDDLNYVLRWGGKGAKWIWQWDTQLHKTGDNTRFINGWDLSPGPLTQTYIGEVALASRTLGELGRENTIELTVENWENPNLAQKLAEGVLFNQAERRNRSVAGNVAQDVTEAFNREALSRFDVAKAAGVIGRPFDDLLPIAPVLVGDAA
ncbi:MAG TPA: hypothetical protein VLG11_04495 [Candidatus Saccharimonadales bacterium]|nr:hypothetical protein [Candidatus Saccharimonadales bacterium]